MTLYVNARVIPSARSAAVRGDAVLVRGERVAAVGEASRLHPDLDPGEEVIDLQGAVVLPGFVDAHVHTGLFARGLFSADLRDCRSLEAALERLAAHLRDRVESAKADGNVAAS